VTRASKDKVLIVDDDESIRNLLRRLATRAGFDADLAKDGSEAIEMLERTEYQIVIVDLMMPRVSGFELLEHINKMQPRPTVIVATAMMNGDIERVDDSLIRRVIRKPFDIDAVTKALVDIAAELAARKTSQSHANAAAQHAAAAAAHSAAAAAEAAAAAKEARRASDSSAAEKSSAAPDETKPAG
jgi:DNA-binding response OmpR family regulator